jgi:hypothetical protein
MVIVDADMTARSKYVLHSVRMHKTTSPKTTSHEKMGWGKKEALNFKDLMLSVRLFIELRDPYLRRET